LSQGAGALFTINLARRPRHKKRRPVRRSFAKGKGGALKLIVPQLRYVRLHKLNCRLRARPSSIFAAFIFMCLAGWKNVVLKFCGLAGDLLDSFEFM